ncbi:MAG: hypothetical protein EXR64_01475 [Dehalococcoidia bacterium]|nr:hypothetical protein [Dehalococcoidia bacterium]
MTQFQQWSAATALVFLGVLIYHAIGDGGLTPKSFIDTLFSPGVLVLALLSAILFWRERRSN